MIPNRHKDIEIPEDKPFANDKLGRLPYVENFESIISLYGETGCVMAINGAWGTGKSTFVKMMVQDMKNKGFKPLYFNAWENDFVSDPLVALLGEMKEVFPNDEKFANIVELGGKIVLDVMAAVGASFIKHALQVDVKDVAASLADTFKGQIDKYAEQQKSLADFKQKLSEYVADNSEEGPVVFFIDELDRCNPRFAVQILERVKHLFDIPNLVFVLIINKQELQHAICGYYGSEHIDAANYLRRFIDIEYQMPDVDKKNYFGVLYANYKLDKVLSSVARNYDGRLKLEADAFKNLMEELISYSDFDLRTIDKFFAHTCLAFQTYGKTEYIFPQVFLLMSYLRIADAELYRQIRNGEVSVMELLTRLDTDFAPILQKKNRDVEYFRNTIIYPIVRLVNVYAPDALDDTFTALLRAQHFQNLDVEEFIRLIPEAKKHSMHGEKELEYVFRHLDLEDYVKIE